MSGPLDFDPDCPGHAALRGAIELRLAESVLRRASRGARPIAGREGTPQARPAVDRRELARRVSFEDWRAAVAPRTLAMGR